MGLARGRKGKLYELAAGLKNEYIANANRKIELYARYKGKPEREWTKEDREALSVEQVRGKESS